VVDCSAKLEGYYGGTYWRTSKYSKAGTEHGVLRLIGSKEYFHGHSVLRTYYYDVVAVQQRCSSLVQQLRLSFY
jgi:hypothetical protein